MAAHDKQFRRYTLFLTAISIPLVLWTSLAYSPTVSLAWLLAFGTLLALAIAGSLLALTISESGAVTAMGFVPHLAAIILLGPFGATALAVLDEAISGFLLRRMSGVRALFNVAQIAILTPLAAMTYVSLGGEVSLDTLAFRPSFPPFLTAALVYFGLNSLVASYALQIVEGQPLGEVWRRAVGGIIVFDVAMSSLAYGVAFLYVRWGALALLSAIIPIIGLRYSYGVNLELQHLNQDLLRVLIKTLEARDKYTSGHSVRVAERTKGIARALGVRPSRVRRIETAALLHDIGKIDLAFSEILRQAGPLTPEQRQLIRDHPDKGVEIVQSVRSIDPEILHCIRHHHERFDGDGYPSGLRGDRIPLGARIISLSDAVDAMLTDRPYRAALDLGKVRQEVLRNSGTQFDPTVVEAALQAGVLDEPNGTLVSH